MVWHIFHFGDRFELPEDMRACRKGPLQFVRLFVAGANDNESHIFKEQWSMLDREENTLLLEGAFIRLLKWAGRRERKFRGYLLNEHYAPATPTQISRVLGLERSKSAGVLGILAKYNLIERVAMPDFAAVVDEPEEKGQPRKGTKGNSQQPTAKSQQPDKTEADGAGGGGRKPAAPAQSFGDDKLDKLYDPECKEFAGEVFVKIFGRAPKAGVLEDHREMGSFASAWSRAQTAGLKPSRLTTLWEKSMKQADKTGRARRMGKVNSPGAVWTSVFNGRVTGMQNAK